RLHKNELNKIQDEEAKYKRLIELNVQEQCMNVIKTAEYQLAAQEREIQVLGWVFDIETGNLIDLNIDFRKILNEIMEIYRLS
ncbi:MAG: carbonic anhydrase, partial [Bacteroidetes bacterium]|nr:carbonic anhydrase [Bacteroidota bacterium]